MTDAIKLKVLPKFPSRLIGGAGIDVTKLNGDYTLDLDYTDFPFVGSVPPNARALFYDPTTNKYMQSSAAGTSGRQRVNTAILPMYVSLTGDNSDGLTPATAFNTVQRAWDFAADNLDLAGNRIQCFMAPGTYTQGLATSKGLVGGNGPFQFMLLGQLQQQATVTITLGSPAVVNWSGSNMAANQRFYFGLSAGGAMPTGVSAYKTYYVLAAGLTSNSFQFATSPAGVPVNASGATSGTITGKTLTNTTISTTSADAIGLGALSFGTTQMAIGGIRLQTTTGGCCYNASGASGVVLGIAGGFPLEFGPCAQTHMVGNHSGNWTISGTNNIVSGGALIHVAALSNSTVALHNTNEDYIDGPNFSAVWADCESCSSMFIDNMLFAGAGSVTCPQTMRSTGGVIIRGSSALPGVGTIEIIDPPIVTVAALPAPSAMTGVRRFVSDATTTSFGTVVVGGGSNNVPVYSTGADWRIG